ncbi:MAG: DUF1761 domain-containing protein [Alphaproteobacteria bacterium]|nr:DUF1761 domain-containing protein [Alphaproteobacteria bacterium]
MGEFNFLAVALGALAFFAVGMLWYGVLFGKLWQRSARLTDEALQSGNMPLIFVLTFLFELLIASTLWHGIERSGASDRATMMMAVGFGATVMVPALGIHYLYLRKTLAHFLIDSGHIVTGMAAMGGVFLLLR